MFKVEEIETTGGQAINLLEPDPDTIDLEDIAQSLSRLCRFNGHTRIPYTVAEHSIMVGYLMLYLHPRNREAFLWGLLHDAAEAFIGDIPRPVKRLFSGVREMESRLMKAICKKFGLDYPCPWRESLKQCDNRALLWEAQAFMKSKGQGYGVNSTVKIDFHLVGGNPLLKYEPPLLEKHISNSFLDAFYTGGTDATMEERPARYGDLF